MNKGLPIVLLLATLATAVPATVASPPASITSRPSLAEQFKKIRTDHDAEQAALSKAVEAAKTEAEAEKAYRDLAPDNLAFNQRMLDLVAIAPADPVARDALIWVLNKPGMPLHDPYGDQFTRAANLLLQHHSDDPEAIRIALSLDNRHGPTADALTRGFYAAAKGREAKGLARMALAQYLEFELTLAERTRNLKRIGKNRYVGFYGAKQGAELTLDHFDDQYAYLLQLRSKDMNAIRAEAENLFSEVIKEYGDLPYVGVTFRELEAAMKSVPPTLHGQPISDSDRHEIQKFLARKRTLAQEAKARLDAMETLADGKPAPEIDALDMNGNRLKLSDQKGKVTLLVFWASWCGPCMREVPHERELVERLKDRPFVLLGVNCDTTREDALKVINSENIPWPNWYDNGPGEGPIQERYRIKSYPSTLLLDAQGRIRHKDLREDRLEEAINQLLSERESSQTQPTAKSTPAKLR